jgi:hypothetical protein
MIKYPQSNENKTGQPKIILRNMAETCYCSMDKTILKKKRHNNSCTVPLEYLLSLPVELFPRCFALVYQLRMPGVYSVCKMKAGI